MYLIKIKIENHRLKRALRIVAKNVLRPDKIVNAIGNKVINPMLRNRMLFQPYHIDIEPTTRCNLTCTFCQVSDWDRSQITDLSFRDFQQIIKRNPYLLSIKLQGLGEPLLNRDIFKMIEYANSEHIETYINTNGTVFDKEKIKKLFESGLSQLSFSLDTPNRKIYEKIRGKDLFDKVVENIEIAVEERDSTLNNAKVSIWCVLSRYNINELLDLVKLAKNLDVNLLTIQTKLTSFGKDQMKQKNSKIKIILSDKNVRKILREAVDFAKKIGLNFNIYTRNYFSKNKPCSYIKHSAYVSAEGEVTPCCILGDPRIISMGNIHRLKRFSKIWNNAQYRRLRNAINKSELPAFCKDCYTES